MFGATDSVFHSVARLFIGPSGSVFIGCLVCLMTLSYEGLDSFLDKRQRDRLIQRKSVSRFARVVFCEFRWHCFSVPWSNKQANMFLKRSKIHEPSFVAGTAVLIKRHAVADALRSSWRCVFNDAAKLNELGTDFFRCRRNI